MKWAKSTERMASASLLDNPSLPVKTIASERRRRISDTVKFSVFGEVKERKLMLSPSAVFFQNRS